MEKFLEKYSRPHPNPKYELEQYVTPSPIVAQIIWHAYISGHLSSKKVVDLGCGTGVFCLAASLLGAYCTCVEIDMESLDTVKNMKSELDLDIELINADATQFYSKFDTVIQNPPFGVVNRGIDIKFLQTAFSISDVVYSIHKSNERSREIIITMAKDYGFSTEILSERFRLKPYYPWHMRRVHEFLVDIYFFSKISR
ncbi:methyltransferase domain-containing protein [Saccharolobus solfataricus]|uniref:Methyltransferase-like protein 5 n=1 Tax=Saccharolobus solfataricus TaxID=2287 RepID=A0A3G8ELV5_SACSO|nr:METTL5 family protein [Saccharolobus solfataricus]AYN75639.1 methyltransferase domain-containing protein [Saccharolobus solfataricus]AYN75799.1 methyltransferase domain-containing protein [Saccharolobus solfataricus]AYP18634.1 methyltransferase domain-containing protein [Saccharolobus solfataricus]AZF69412.1 methyltransferase domain-containing protein [Saccharolobus solfataricus]AZF72032.1 methyltransferase domain-containing protein [Saccharolobus solfataricus]